jgi:transposase
MTVVYPRCGGIDVHKKRVSACRMWPSETGNTQIEQENFGTCTRELRRMAGWFADREVGDIALEATGPYWRPVWNVLEACGLRLTLANPGHIRAIPGHKTDRRDARWIADLHQHGLVPASFVPGGSQRQLRDLTRMRTKVVQDRSRVVCRLQAVLEDANIKLDSVVSDVLGVSSQAMLRGLIGGALPAELADLALGSLRRKRADLELALEGEFRPHHGFLVQRLLMQERSLRQQERALEREIWRQMDESRKQALQLWSSIPGVNHKVAAVLVAELGIRAEQFPDAQHAASWVAICPGNHESAGKQLSGKTRKGNRWLRTALVESAWAAARSKGTYLSALYSRLAPRKGAKRALVAVAHSILVAAYHMLKTGQPYREVGADYFDRLHPHQAAQRLVQRLSRLGYQVDLKPLEEAQTATAQ